MTLAWDSVLLALVPSVAILWLLYFEMTTQPTHSRAGGYLLLGGIGLVGYIFTKYVKKERYQVESCTRCDYRHVSKLDYDNRVEL